MEEDALAEEVARELAGLELVPGLTVGVQAAKTIRHAALKTAIDFVFDIINSFL